MLRKKSGTPNYNCVIRHGVYPLTLVDKHDSVIGQAEYEEIHRKGLLHRFVLVYVLNKSGKFFLQKRASTKPHGRLLAESVCAHVRYGEDYLQTAKRRLREELGIIKENKDLVEITKTHVVTSEDNWKNNAFVKIYECIVSEKPIINNAEIQEGFFYPMKKVIKLFKEQPESFVPGFKSTFHTYLQSKNIKESI